MSKESEIRVTITKKGGVPPFTVWSSAFLDMRDGKPIPNSGMLAHREIAQDINGAIDLYLDVASGTHGTDVKIIQVPRIVDSTGKQVYP